MKKLTKLHTILIAVLIIVLAGSAYFMFSSRGVEAKQPDVRDKITLAMMQLQTAIEKNNLEPLKRQLDELQAKLRLLDRDVPLFPAQPATGQIEKIIVDGCNKLGLTLLKLEPNDKAGTITVTSSTGATGNKYNKAEYTARVKGDLGRINSLIGEVEGGDFATLTIEDMEITYYEETEDEQTTKWWEGEFTAVTIYQYK